MFKLIRYKNLLFILIIQLLMAKAIIVPTLAMFHIPTLTPFWMLSCIILATMLIAAGGYVINDYFDLKIDRINRPDRLLIGTIIEKSAAMRLYQILTITGVIIGLVMAIILRNMTVGLIFVVVPGMLWFYSASYKRQFLIGNIIVALAAALVPLLPVIIESALLSQSYGDLIQETPVIKTLYIWVSGFAVFAFIWTLIRELIKDMQDEYGDREMECRTVAIVCGLKWTKVIVSALVVISVAALGWLIITYFHLPNDESTSLRYFLFAVVAPSICLLILLWSNYNEALSHASLLSKFIMVSGVLYSLVYYYLLAKTYGIVFLGLFQVL